MLGRSVGEVRNFEEEEEEEEALTMTATAWVETAESDSDRRGIAVDTGHRSAPPVE